MEIDDCLLLPSSNYAHVLIFPCLALLFSAFCWYFAALWASGPPDIALTAAEKAKHLPLLPSSHEWKAAG